MDKNFIDLSDLSDRFAKWSPACLPE